MKKMILLAMVLTLMLSLSACMCQHETWNEADCVTPKTCADCGETEGAPLGHSWKAADCETPKTCENCGLTEGEAKGHSWTEADCENPKTCQNCKLTEGEALGHAWVDATTEAPKTCSTCAKTEGEKITTDPRFVTANNEQLFGRWVTEISEYVPDFDMDMEISIFMDFHNDGTMLMDMELKDPETFMELMIQISVESTYEGMAAEGYDRESADEAFVAAYGMGVEEYMRSQLEGVDMNQIMGMVDISYVYYAEGDQLYTSLNWNTEMTVEKFSIEDGVLYLFEEGITEPTAFNRVEE